MHNGIYKIIDTLPGQIWMVEICTDFTSTFLFDSMLQHMKTRENKIWSS